MVNQQMDLLIKPADMPDQKAGNMIGPRFLLGDEKGPIIHTQVLQCLIKDRFGVIVRKMAAGVSI
jgi:hypothetical protein